MTRVKFCGVTRSEDAERAADIGASYVGVIFAGSRRQVTASRARAVLATVRGRVRAVGVFGPVGPEDVVTTAHAAQVDVVQLHGDPGPEDVAAVRERFGGEVWAAYRVRDSRLDGRASELAAVADAVVLDAWHDAALGGVGQPFDWAALASRVVALRGGRASLILAGGLRPANVAQAVHLLAPDVVDVSSGVESAPGIKDPQGMREFMDAVRAATEPRSRIG